MSIKQGALLCLVAITATGTAAARQSYYHVTHSRHSLPQSAYEPIQFAAYDEKPGASDIFKYLLTGTLSIAAGAVTGILTANLDENIGGGGLITAAASIPVTIAACKISRALGGNPLIATAFTGGSHLVAAAACKNGGDTSLIRRCIELCKRHESAHDLTIRHR